MVADGSAATDADDSGDCVASVTAENSAGNGSAVAAVDEGVGVGVGVV